MKYKDKQNINCWTLDRGFELELSWVTAKQPKHERVPADVAKAAEDAAKAELADSDSEDDM